MSKSKAVAALVDRLVQELESCREAGGEYPLTMTQLASRLDPAPDSAAIRDAIKHKSFTTRVIAAVKGTADSPIALLADIPALAGSPLTLEAALRAKGATRTAPPWTVSQLKAAVQKPLQSAFLDVWSRRVAAGELPAFVVRVPKGKSFVVYHQDQPPPPSAAERDAVRLVEQLRHRSLAQGPLLTLPALAEAVGITNASLKKAIKEKAFTDAVEVSNFAPLGTLVVLRSEIESLAASAPLLERLLAAGYEARVHAIPLRDLTAPLKGSLKDAVEAFLSRDDLARHLPGEFAFVLAKGAGKQGPTRLFFRMENLQRGRGESMPPPEPRPAPAPAVDFATLFDAAFERLDRERGSYNFVSLVDLRAALPELGRAAFDAGLQQLRREQRYWLKSAEGFHGLRPEERDAAIPEEGELLLLVSKART